MKRQYIVIIGGSDAGISAALHVKEVGPQAEVTGENAAGGNKLFEDSLETQAVKIFKLVAARTGLRDMSAQESTTKCLLQDCNF
jgi:thioredoxin reductase